MASLRATGVGAPTTSLSATRRSVLTLPQRCAKASRPRERTRDSTRDSDSCACAFSSPTTGRTSVSGDSLVLAFSAETHASPLTSTPPSPVSASAPPLKPSFRLLGQREVVVDRRSPTNRFGAAFSISVSASLESTGSSIRSSVSVPPDAIALLRSAVTGPPGSHGSTDLRRMRPAPNDAARHCGRDGLKLVLGAPRLMGKPRAPVWGGVDHEAIELRGANVPSHVSTASDLAGADLASR
jgi:hypothetical protein